MHARLVRTDATTEAVVLPAGAAALPAIAQLIGCETVTVIHLALPCPAGPGVAIWLDDDPMVAGRPALNPAAGAIAAFLSRGRIRRDFAGPVVFTGCALAAMTPLTTGHDQVITTATAGQLRGSTAKGQQPGEPGPEVR
jgi:hypothetical protein